MQTQCVSTQLDLKTSTATKWSLVSTGRRHFGCATPLDGAIG